MRRTVLLLAVLFSVTAVAAAQSPLYMITYDHGGLILWGADHFAERLREHSRRAPGV